MDDGWSGTNFERPDWKRLLTDIEDGKIGCVIVKDISRIGRNYLQVGFYREVLFREKGVRFITISNGVDSTQQSSNEFAPFLNIMNEWYVRNTNRKIKSLLHAKGTDGNIVLPMPFTATRILTNEKVERPSYYLAKQGLSTCRGNCDMSRPYTWTATTISDIVSKPEYMGIPSTSVPTRIPTKTNIPDGFPQRTGFSLRTRRSLL